MLTTGSINTETFSAALLGLEDLSLRVTAAALHVAAHPEEHPRLRLMLADLSEVLESCEGVESARVNFHRHRPASALTTALVTT